MVPRAMDLRRAKDLIRHRAPRLAYRFTETRSRLRPSRHAPLDDAWAITQILGPGMEVVVDRDGVWLREPSGLTWRHVPRVHGPFLGLERGAGFEGGEVGYLRDQLAADSVLLDIGANIGVVAVRLAHEIPGLRVIAVEPSPPTYESLVANVARNDVGETTEALQLALGREPGSVLMTTNLNAANHVVPGSRTAASAAEVEVPRTTVDALVVERELARLDAIKLDVEGFELDVLRGATETLRKFRPLIVIEIEARWTHRYGYEPDEIFDLLESLGYRAERFVGDELVASSGDRVRSRPRRTTWNGPTTG